MEKGGAEINSAHTSLYNPCFWKKRRADLTGSALLTTRKANG
jgi:hypothetical protein